MKFRITRELSWYKLWVYSPYLWVIPYWKPVAVQGTLEDTQNAAKAYMGKSVVVEEFEC